MNNKQAELEKEIEEFLNRCYPDMVAFRDNYINTINPETNKVYEERQTEGDEVCGFNFKNIKEAFVEGIKEGKDQALADVIKELDTILLEQRFVIPKNKIEELKAKLQSPQSTGNDGLFKREIVFGEKKTDNTMCKCGHLKYGHDLKENGSYDKCHIDDCKCKIFTQEIK
jgi:hypothetical protein